jgi:hypothetical protein
MLTVLIDSCEGEEATIFKYCNRLRRGLPSKSITCLISLVTMIQRGMLTMVALGFIGQM